MTLSPYRSHPWHICCLFNAERWPLWRGFDIREKCFTFLQHLHQTATCFCNPFPIPYTTKNLIKKLQAIQNTAVHLVTNSYKYDHITPIFKDLHWLPVQQRINLKILLFTFKCLHGQAPKYLQDLLIWSQPKGLMSDNKHLPVVPKSKQVTYGEHAFSNAAPRLWNALPNYIKLSVNIESIQISS